MASPEAVRVEVVYVGEGNVFLRALEVPAGSSARGAIDRSRVLQEQPEIDLSSWGIGIFGRPCMLETTLREGDRVEIYRPLRRDPKQARRLRARRD